MKKKEDVCLPLKNALDEQALTSEQEATAKRLGKLYNLEPTNVDYEWLESMLTRVDVLPEALVLTQAANESAWGTSRFAKEANNYFGQWCYSKGCGLVPLQRTEGMTHEVAKFSSPQVYSRLFYEC
ncbi:putative Bax protein [Vibrio variabilis]|uniref:Bax protein n=1 Tax=Vibrio variabilis TaxID=990271 RepID=A0ABQ0J9T2_9VIBR|nr:putative Bax protein [Vibrio variabilis]